MTIVAGFDVSNVPTADLMEFAAKLLRLDQQTLAGIYAATGKGTELIDNNTAIADLLETRARAVRALALRELDS